MRPVREPDERLPAGQRPGPSGSWRRDARPHFKAPARPHALRAKGRSTGASVTVRRGTNPARAVVWLIAVVRYTVGAPAIMAPVDVILAQKTRRTCPVLLRLSRALHLVDDNAANDSPDHG